MKTLLILLLSALPAFAGSSITLAWDGSPASDNVTSYALYEKTGTTWTKVATIAAPTTNYTIADVPAGPHVYAVTASNARESLRSNEVTVPPEPGAPKGFKIVVEVTVR